MLDELRYRRNLLAYPAGVKAGFDPTHVAAKNLRFSGVAQGGNFVSLTQGRKGIKVGAGTPTFVLDGSIGIATNYTASNQDTAFTGNSTVNDGSVTLAAVVRFNAISGTQVVFSTSQSNSGWRFYISGGVLGLVAGGVAAVISSTTLSGNVPYLIIGSINASASNFLALRLDTGKIDTSSSTGASPGAPDGIYWIGNNAFLEHSNAKIAAAMFSAHFMSVHEMCQWAKDPWAFWYPPSPRFVVRDTTILGAVYLDPTQLGTNIVLSNLNLTATQMAAATANTRAIAHHASGKYYCEFTVNVTGDMQVGICNAVTPLTEYLGQDNTHSIGVDDGGGWLGAGGTTTAPGLIAGHVYGLAIDINSKKAWLKDITAGGNWNSDGSANPVTGVGGATFSTIS